MEEDERAAWLSLEVDQDRYNRYNIHLDWDKFHPNGPVAVVLLTLMKLGGPQRRSQIDFRRSSAPFSLLSCSGSQALQSFGQRFRTSVSANCLDCRASSEKIREKHRSQPHVLSGTYFMIRALH